MRVLVMSVILFLNFTLQTTLFQSIGIMEIKPNTALIIVVSYAILREDVEGCIIGFFAGLLQDIFFMDFIGLQALLFAVTGYLCGKPFRDFFRENYWMPLGLTVVAVFSYEFAFYVLRFLLFRQFDVLFYIRRIILPETFYTAVLVIPIYKLLYGVNKKLEEREKRKQSIFSKDVYK